MKRMAATTTLSKRTTTMSTKMQKRLMVPLSSCLPCCFDLLDCPVVFCCHFVCGERLGFAAIRGACSAR